MKAGKKKAKGSRRPGEDVVVFVIKKIFKNRKAVPSLAKLTGLVQKELKKVEPSYSISQKRVRVLAIRTRGITLKIHTKKGKIVKKCPSCGHSLRKSFTRNLSGRKLPVRLSCPKCGYLGTNGKWIPRKYEFRSV